VRLKANQAVGTILGTIQTVLLFGDTLIRTQAANAFAERLKIKDTKERRNPLFLLIILTLYIIYDILKSRFNLKNT
jgi:hypothetical protein